VAALLRKLCATDSHRFWPDDASLMDDALFVLPQTLTSNLTTDVYLLGLALKKGGRLATLDPSIPASAVVGGEQALEIVPA
jgi:hypothetical protein